MENKLSEIKLTYKRRNISFTRFTSSRDVNKLIHQLKIDYSLQEHFLALFFDRALNCVGFIKLSTGGMDSTVVDSKLIYTTALGCGASNVILAHNHPTGNMKPSDADLNITKKIKEGLSLLDIKLMDHIIINPNKINYYSFADEDLIF